jgi:general secretion pathway protein D
MIANRFTGVLLAGALLSAAPLPVPAQQQNALRLHNADLKAFIQDVARSTGTTFIVDPRVQGTVNISREQSMDEADLLGTLLAVLRANGLVAVPAGTATYRVIPDDTAAQQPGTAGGTQGFSTQILPMQRVDARIAAETLKPLVGRGGVITATAQGNSLLIADYADNIRRIRGLVAQIDQDRASIQTVTLRNTSARELATTLNGIYANGGQRNGLISILPVDSSNSLVIRGDGAQVQQVAKMAGDLDQRAERRGDVSVVRLQHASAEQLLPVLQRLVGQSGGDGGSEQAGDSAIASAGATAEVARDAQVITPAGGKRPTIVRYPGSNALVISADPDTQRVLMDVIRQLDVHREQVLVEAIVVEISDSAAKRLGVQLIAAGRNGNAPILATQYAGAPVGINALAGAVIGSRSSSGGDEDDDDDTDSALELARNAAAQSLLGLSGSLIGLGGQTDDHVFGMIIDAVKSDTGSNLLSTPSIMTLDNEEASILVGQEVPITTGEVLGNANDNPFRTIQRKDVGIQLQVTPQINSAGGITLKIKQEVSAIAGPVSTGSSELILNKREIETRVVAANGAIVALGGLLDQNERGTVEKVPLLGDIPGLGVLFRHKSREREKTNLMVFLRPTIIGNEADAQRMTAARYDTIRNQQMREDGGEAALDALVRDYLRTTPPVAPPPGAPTTPLVRPQAP